VPPPTIASKHHQAQAKPQKVKTGKVQQRKASNALGKGKVAAQISNAKEKC